MPLCLLVLVSSFFTFQNLPFFSFTLSKYVGARACIGRKYVDFNLSNQSVFFCTILFFFFSRFAETESTAVLAMLVSHYKFTIKEEPQFVSETFEERKSRILSVRQVLTLTYVLK